MSTKLDKPIITYSLGDVNIYRIYKCNVVHRLENELLESKVYEHFQYKSGKVYVDVGASIGIWTMLINSHCKPAMIYSIEPHPYGFINLYYNIKTNKLDNCIPISFALGEKTDTIHMNVHEHEIQSVHSSTGSVYPCLSWDDFVIIYNITSCYMVKVDTEGDEMSILNGMSTVYPDCIVLANYHHSLYGKETNTQLNDKLCSMGYIISEGKEPVTFAYRKNLNPEDIILPQVLYKKSISVSNQPRTQHSPSNTNSIKSNRPARFISITKENISDVRAEAKLPHTNTTLNNEVKLKTLYKNPDGTWTHVKKDSI